MELDPDTIEIKDLEISACVGVSDEERAVAQRLTVSVVLQPQQGFGGLDDELVRTVDYVAVCEELRTLSTERRDRLIETLAHNMAEHLLERFALTRVDLELRKFVLPETKYVAVRVSRKSSEIS